MLRNFATAGSVIDSIAGAAGNATRLDSLNFSVEGHPRSRGPGPHRRRPSGRLPRHVDALAADERLGPVCSLNDQSQTVNFNEPFANDGLAAGASSSKAAAPVPLEAGSQQETAQVTMVYALMPPALRK